MTTLSLPPTHTHSTSWKHHLHDNIVPSTNSHTFYLVETPSPWQHCPFHQLTHILPRGNTISMTTLSLPPTHTHSTSWKHHLHDNIVPSTNSHTFYLEETPSPWQHCPFHQLTHILPRGNTISMTTLSLPPTWGNTHIPPTHTHSTSYLHDNIVPSTNSHTFYLEETPSPWQHCPFHQLTHILPRVNTISMTTLSLPPTHTYSTSCKHRLHDNIIPATNSHTFYLV